MNVEIPGMDKAIEEVVAVVKPRGYVTVEYLLKELRHTEWLSHGKLDTRKRRLRAVKEHANKLGIPLCSCDEGYYWATTREECEMAAQRHLRHARGAMAQGMTMLDIAAKLPSGRLPFED